jgi:hypothetical protein
MRPICVGRGADALREDRKKRSDGTPVCDWLQTDAGEGKGAEARTKLAAESAVGSFGRIQQRAYKARERAE